MFIYTSLNKEHIFSIAFDLIWNSLQRLIQHAVQNLELYGTVYVTLAHPNAKDIFGWRWKVIFSAKIAVHRIFNCMFKSSSGYELGET